MNRKFQNECCMIRVCQELRVGKISGYKGPELISGVLETFYPLIFLVYVYLYAFVKSHRTIQLKVNFTIYNIKLYLEEIKYINVIICHQLLINLNYVMLNHIKAPGFLSVT